MPFQFRQSNLGDLNALWNLLSAYQNTYLDDFETLDMNWVFDLIYRQEIFGIYQDTDNLVGALWISDRINTLHGTIHFLIQPNQYRKAVHAFFLEEIIQFVFEHYRLQKIKAVFKSNQPTPGKFLRRLGFQQVGLLKQESLVGGEPVDVYIYELPHTVWENHYHELRQKKIKQQR